MTNNNYVTKLGLVRLLCKYANAEQLEIFDAISIFEKPNIRFTNGLKPNPCDLREIKWNMDKYILDDYNPHCFTYHVLADVECPQSPTRVCTGEKCNAHSICGISGYF